MIGIVARYDGDIVKVPSSLIKIINDYNKTPIILCPTKSYDENFDCEKIEKILKDLDGIIIPGGIKWSSIDSYVLRYAIENNISALCICLGCQLLGLCDDYKVEEKLELNASNINHNSKNKYVHSIFIKEDSLLYKIIGKKEIEVNSRHNYHINNIIGKVDAYSSDGYIEALEIEGKKFILGLQFHPEDMYDDDDIKKIFDSFFKSCEI